MPLRGLFSKKNKSRTDVGDSIPPSPTTAATESPATSPTIEYVKPDSFIPSSPNGRNTLHPDDALSSPSKSAKSSVYASVAASPASSKLRLPFGRKKAAKSSSSNNSNQDEKLELRPPTLSRLSTGAASEADAAEMRRKLGPPPSRSAIFSAYGDPHSAHSTRSLPNEHSTNEAPVEPLPNVPKRPLFPWSSKSQPNSTKVKTKKPSPPKAEDISAALEDSSFNLKSFRHLGDPSSAEVLPPPIRSGSIPNSANSSSTSLVPPRPLPGTRSRNSSFGSLNDPSASQQRISVAAFREAQARRSLAGSPVPGARSPSPGPNLSVHHRSPDVTEGNEVRPRRTSMVALGKSSYSSSEDDSSENEDDDDSDSGTNNPTARSRPGNSNAFKSKSKSEAGHGSSSISPYSRSDIKAMPSAFPALRPDAASKMATPRSQSDVYGQGVYGSKNAISASVSTSALSSNSGIGPSTSPPQSNLNARTPAVKSAKNAPPPPRSSDSDSDDSDDAPLATLVPPKRPGSAASSRSIPQSDAQSVRSTGVPGGLRTRVNSNVLPKPLIDINELTGSNKRAPESGAAATKPPKSQAGFTGGATLLSAGTTQGPTSVKTMPSTPSSVISTEPPGRRFVSPPPSPPLSSQRPARSTSTSPSALSRVPAGVVQRRVPMGRKDTDALSMASSATAGSSNDSSSGGKKKDPLSDRLSKVVAQSVGSSPTSTSPPLANLSNPLSRPLRRETAPAPAILDRSADLDIPFTSSPSPTLERPPLGHRRTPSSEIKEETPAGQAPPKGSAPIPTRRVDYFAKQKSVEVARKSRDSATIEDLADLLGAGIKLVSVNGEDQPDMDLPFSEKEPARGSAAEKGKGKDKEDDKDSFVRLAYAEPPPSPDRITPIVVKTIPPVSSFSVTSRPQHSRGASVNILSSSSSTATVVDRTTGTASTTTTTTTTQTQTRSPPLAGIPRPRSSTLVPTSSSNSTVVTQTTLTTSTPKSPAPPAALPAPSSFSKAAPPVSSAFSTSSSSSSSGSDSDSEDMSSQNSDREPDRKRPSMPSKPSNPPPRTRSASQIPAIPASSQSSRFVEPSKPFATSQSPASSTGGSSSGRGAPITPRDGSDIGEGLKERRRSKEETWGSGVSGLNFRPAKHGHARKRSIAFEDEAGSEGKGKSKESPEVEEARRRDRRRSEARAAIELGNTINGRGPVLDDDDEDLPISQTAPAARMNAMHPMMMNGPIAAMPGMPGMLAPQITGGAMWGWPSMPQMSQMAPGQMLSPGQFMVPPPADPALFAAHQQAMMYAKQAYQMAVAQQAMAAAAEEWDRGSTIGFTSSQSMYGMPPSSLPPMMSPAISMGGGNGWSTGSMIFPASNSRTSMYGSGAMSEYGGNGGRGGANWSSSKSAYGESFGSSPSPRNPPVSGNRARMSSYSRDSTLHPPVPPIPPHANSNKNARPTGQSSNPRARAISQPARPVRHHDTGSPANRKSPPSSWKTNG
ncbi:hypothetical protein GYMLUDRAFT_52562 [Collybiopsis luxurians FD-317 M1]|nr:hypothetical protein GYMLUDRAFT_52562 [Collybiopsis luxurians FD-317 M1]